MNALIAMPKTVTQKDEWYVFPTGIAYVSSALKKKGICNVYTCNLNLTDNVEEAICNQIDEKDIDVILTGGLSIQYNSIKKVIVTAKRHKPQIITMVGGGYITSSPEIAMEAIPEIDIGMIGEGEITVCELLESIVFSKSLDDVSGIIYKKGTDNWVKTARREVIKDLDSICFPDYDGFDFESTLKYSPVNYGIYQERAAVLITSRGCPYNCTFCFHPQGDGYRIRSLDNVFAELDWLVEKYKIKSVLILDEMFGGNNKRLKEFCERIKKYNLQWWVETRVEFATKSNLQLMKESGCVQILLGIENVNDSILKSMNKQITVVKIEQALENAYEVGISAPGVIIFGDTAETRETADKTIKWWKEHSQYHILLTTLQVYPGSAIWNYAVDNGILSSKQEQINHIINGCPKLNLTSMTDAEFSELCKEIGLLNQTRDVYMENAAILNEIWTGNKLKADVTGKCAKCGSSNLWAGVDILAEGGGAEPFICSNCGQSHGNGFQENFFKNAIGAMKQLFCENHKVALWGQGRKLVKIFSEYPEVKELDFFYVDNSPIKRGKDFYGLAIHGPEELVDFKPDILIIAVGDASMLLMKDKSVEILGQSDLEKTRIVTLGELMNPAFGIGYIS